MASLLCTLLYGPYSTERRILEIMVCQLSCPPRSDSLATNETRPIAAAIACSSRRSRSREGLRCSVQYRAEGTIEVVASIAWGSQKSNAWMVSSEVRTDE